MISRLQSEQAFVMNVEAARIEVEVPERVSPEALFEAYARAVHAYAITRVGDASAAEDITSEVFLEAIRQTKARQKRDPLPWLYGIARRKVADHLRRTSRRRMQPLTESLLTGEDPGKLAERAEQSARLRSLVDALPAAQKEALLLHYLEQLSAQQIASAMNRSVAAVNSLLQRARESLRTRGMDLEL